MRVEALLRESAGRLGQKTALVCGRASLSYADLDQKSDRLAAALVKQGVKPGAAVAVLLDDGIAATVSAFAVLKAGATLAPVDPALEPEEIAAALNAMGAVGLVTEARLATAAATALASVRSISFVVLAGGDRAGAGGATCVAYEAVVEAVQFTPVAVPHLTDAGGAALLIAGESGGADVFTHADLTAAAALGAPLPAASIVGAPLSTEDGIHALLMTVRAGATYMLAPRGAGRARLRRPQADRRRPLALTG